MPNPEEHVNHQMRIFAHFPSDQPVQVGGEAPEVPDAAQVRHVERFRPERDPE